MGYVNTLLFVGRSEIFYRHIEGYVNALLFVG